MSPEAERKIPKNIEAERGVLGGLLFPDEAAAAREVFSILIPDDFFNIPNRTVFESIMGVLLESGVTDPLLVLTSLEKREEIHNVGGRQYLSELAKSVASAANVVEYAKLVREASVKRTLLFAAEKIAHQAQNGATSEEVAASAKAMFDRIAIESAPAGRRIKWKSLDDLASSSSTVEWLWRGFIGKGLLTLLASDPKAGKTTMLAALIAAWQKRTGSFAGQPAHNDRGILYVSEDPPASLYQTLLRFGVRRDGLHLRDRTDMHPHLPISELCAASIEEAKAEGCDLVVIDTLSAHGGLAAEAEKDSGAIERVMGPMIRLAGTGPAVVLSHHLGRSGTIRGSTALEGRSDIIVEFRKFGQTDDGPKSTQRVLTTRGKFTGEETPEEIVIDLQGDAYVLLGDASSARLRLVIDRVVAFVLGAARWVTISEVEDAVGGNRDAVLRALKSASAPGGVLGFKKVGKSHLYAATGTP